MSLSLTDQSARVARPDHASVLIVDDSGFDRARIKRLCAAFDFTVTLTCVDTLSALKSALEKSRFDLILLDYSLPDGEGARGLGMISASRRNAGVATIIITSRAEPEVMRTAMAHGAFDFIRKGELSADTIRQAALNALQRAGLMQRAMRDSAARHRLETAVHHLSDRLSDTMAPMIEGMVHRLDRLDRGGLEPMAETAERNALRHDLTAMADTLSRLRKKGADNPVLGDLVVDLMDRFAPTPSDPPRLFAPRGSRSITTSHGAADVADAGLEIDLNGAPLGRHPENLEEETPTAALARAPVIGGNAHGTSHHV